MSNQSSGQAGPSGTPHQQANELTRNFVLGLPKEGLRPDSPEAAELQAAEAFVADIQQEMLAYDIANAQAVEAYARRWWARIPFFGRHTRESLAAEEAEAAAAKRVQGSSNNNHNNSHYNPSALGQEGFAAAAAAGAGTLGEHVASGEGGGRRGNMKVERRSALDAELLEKAQKEQKVNTWLFKRRHPGWVPLLQRWWVPWVCTLALVGVWTPDVWKLRTLYYCDYQYAQFRQTIHKAYWRATMKKEDYDALMADIEAQRPSSVKSTDCPF